MASALRNLIHDGSRYVKCYRHFLECSTAIQRMQDFVENLLPDILTGVVNGKSHLNVIGVGSGTGVIDLKMLSALHRKYPGITVDNEVVEPNPQHLRSFIDTVSQTPGLDHIKFNWNNMTSEEFEEQWKEKKMTKKADFIHMIQVLYFVKDRGATISFYKSLLNKNGKLLIILISGDGGLLKMRQTYKNQICNSDISYVSTEDIKTLLNSKGLSYQSYKLPSEVDITECFTEGDENGELLLDFLTEVLHFSKSASPELKAGVMEFLRHPDYSKVANSKVILNNNYELLVID